MDRSDSRGIIPRQSVNSVSILRNNAACRPAVPSAFDHMTLAGIYMGAQCVCFMCMCVSVVPTHSSRVRGGGGRVRQCHYMRLCLSPSMYSITPERVMIESPDELWWVQKENLTTWQGYPEGNVFFCCCFFKKFLFTHEERCRFHSPLYGLYS